MEGHLCIKGKGIHDIIPSAMLVRRFTFSINTFAPKVIPKVKRI